MSSTFAEYWAPDGYEGYSSPYTVEATGAFIRGRKHGHWREEFIQTDDDAYNETQISKGSYVDGLKDGIWKFSLTGPYGSYYEEEELLYVNGEEEFP